jgi:hypothetical protein
MWGTRNSKLHGWDVVGHDSVQWEVLHKELGALYLRKHEYPMRVQWLLRGSYKMHILEAVTKIANWLDAYKSPGLPTD